MTKDKIQYYTYKITTANKTQMITILYEMVLDYIAEAEECLDDGDVKGFTEGLTRASSCIDELRRSLHLEYDLARDLFSLYLFEKKQLIRASGKLDKEILAHVKKTFRAFFEAYKKIENMDNEKAIMQNVPRVYAGLTYSKNSLSESLSGDLRSRGLKA